MIFSTLLRAGYGNISLLCLALLAVSHIALADSILAFAPVTALASLEGLNARQLGGACPAVTQTACADGVGCCPKGAACTYSRNVPVCDESCNGGPNCPNGGCCQAGYVCGTTNNLCSPAAKPTHAPAPIQADGKKKVDDEEQHGDDSIVITPTPPFAPLHAEPTPSTDDDPSLGGDSGSVHLSTPRGTPTIRSSHSVAPATSTTSRNGGTQTGGPNKYVAGVASNKTPSPSAQATSTGAAHSIEVADSLTAVIVGWIAGLVVLI